MADTNWASGNLTPTGAQVNTAASVVQTIYGGGSLYGYMIRNTLGTSLFEIEGSTGKTYIKGNVGIGTTGPGNCSNYPKRQRP